MCRSAAPPGAAELQGTEAAMYYCMYSGPAYWEGNGGQVFFRGRRTSRTGATLFRQPFPCTF